MYLVYKFVFTSGEHPLSLGCDSSPADFCVFWKAAALSWNGQGLDVFDQNILHGRAEGETGGWFPWLHPPATLMIFAPLGAVSPAAAWIIYTIVALATYWGALRLLLGANRSIWLDFALAPAILPAFILGQLTTLWLAGLIIAFEALRRGRTVLAGVVIGLLTMKPTLGILIPIALLASGAWITIFAATATTLLVQGGATAVFGVEYWTSMVAIYQEHTVRMLNVLPELDRMASLPTALAIAGLSGPMALTVQSGLTLLLAGLVAWTWRGAAKDFDTRMALLCAAIPLATPYLWFYDAALATISGIYLIRAGHIRPTEWGKAAYILLWLGPGLLMWQRALMDETPVAASYLTFPILVVALVLAIRRPRHGLEVRA